MWRIVGTLGVLLSATMAFAQDFNTLKGHGGPVMDIAIHPETGRVATASFDNSVGFWDGREPVWLEGHSAAVVTLEFVENKFLVSGGDDFQVLLWSHRRSDPVKIAQHKGKVSDIAYSENTRSFATASWDGTIEYLKASDLNDATEVIETSQFSSMTLTGHDAGVNAVAFSERGGLFSASSDGTIRYWSVDGSEISSRVVVSNGFGINKMVLNDKGDWLAYGSVDGVTRVVHPETGDTLHDFTLERRPILSMAYHAKTAQLAVGDGYGYIMIIDTNDWSIARDFRAMRRGPVWALAFSPDGTQIYAGGIEDIAYAWPVTLLEKFDPAGGETRSFLQDPKDMANGERQFMRKCSICHALTADPSRKAGPTLYNLMNRPAGTILGYNYSETLKNSDIVWSDEAIHDLFRLGPDHFIPGSKMPMQRITKVEDRQDLIDFLRQAGGADPAAQEDLK
ncbi:Cytochrome c2 [Roseovarius albus]|uniref:Cytochrome c2 n=1 Tax=Roseovarius albus TaxID=1247867 RepID=A0A1X6YG77_9RHOB|nr:c-type cytochrome [Roseovarius albus]SLN20729.1 Cytochrome c2 [Roseovarius albus]